MHCDGTLHLKESATIKEIAPQDGLESRGKQTNFKKKIEKSPKAIISDALMRILKKSVVNLAVLAISLCHHVVSQLA
jgi:hypothetical protein